MKITPDHAKRAAKLKVQRFLTIYNSFAFDSMLRGRVGGLHLTWHFLEETVLPKWSPSFHHAAQAALRSGARAQALATTWTSLLHEDSSAAVWRAVWALHRHQRCILDQTDWIGDD